MNELLIKLQATSPLEAIAAAIGLAYLLLAVRRNLLCWLCAFISTAIYLVVAARESLYMQVALQVFYLVMAVAGFIEWKRGRTEPTGVLIRTWTVPQHLFAIAAVIVGALLNGWILETYTNGANPYLDSLVTWGSVITTWMVTRRVLENWLYWIVVDALGAYLFFSQGLLVTALLFVVYVGIVVRGYIVWRREHRAQVALEAVHVPA